MKTLTSCVFGAFSMAASVSVSSAAHVVRGVGWQIDDEIFAGKRVYPAEVDGKLPGLLMVPNWMGPTERSLEKARRVAGNDYEMRRFFREVWND